MRRFATRARSAFKARTPGAQLDKPDLMVATSIRHHDLVRRHLAAGGEAVTPHRHLWFALTAEGFDCQWAFAPNFCISLDLRTREADDFIDQTYRFHRQRIAVSRGSWKRACSFHFRWLIGDFLAAREMANRIGADRGRWNQVLVPVDPANVRVWGAFLEDDSFALFTKALIPDATLINESSEEVITGAQSLRLFPLVDFVHQEGSGNKVSATDELVMPAAMRTPWEPFTHTDLTQTVVGSVMGDHTAPAIAVTNPIDTWVVAAEISGEDAVAISASWVAKIWLPRIEEVSVACARLLDTAAPSRLFVADHVLPDVSLLADEAVSRGVPITLLPHNPAPVDIRLWVGVPGVDVVTGTKSAREWWTRADIRARRSSSCFTKLREAAKKPARIRTSTLLRVLYIGGLSHELHYPIVDPAAYFKAQQVLMTPPADIASSVEMSIRPRAHWESSAWYDAYPAPRQILDTETPLPELLSSFDLAVVLEMSSGAQLEAIAAGCATVSVSSEPTADRWRANGDVASSILDPAVVPVIPPEAFWPLLNTFVEDRSQLDILFTRQLAWLRDELG